MLNIIQYGSLKTDIPGTPLKKGGTRMPSKSPDYPGDLGGSPGHKYVKPSVLEHNRAGLYFFL